MGKYEGEIRERIYGGIVIFLVIIICFITRKILFISYGDLIFYSGILLIVVGFLYSILKLEHITIGQTIIVGGVITMFLGYII